MDHDEQLTSQADQAGRTATVAGSATQPAEAGWQASDASFRRLMEHSPFIVFHVSGNRLDYVSPASTSLLGFTPEECYALNPLSLERIYPDDRARFADATLQAQRGHPTRCEVRMMHKDGHPVWTEHSLVPSLDALGQQEGVGGIIRDITHRKRVEQEHERLLQEVQQAHAQLQTLSAQLFEAHENERRAIAYDLHDEIGQVMLAVKANLETVQLACESPALAERVAASARIVDDALEQIRALALDLRPSTLDDFGLAAALEWYLERQARSARFKITFQSDLPDRRFAPMVETAGFRVAQAALLNIARHSQAQHVHVTLRLIAEARELELVIRDDGVGFDVAEALDHARRGQSLGLPGIQERARLAGGGATIKSTPGLGTEIRAWFPVQGEER